MNSEKVRKTFQFAVAASITMTTLLLILIVFGFVSIHKSNVAITEKLNSLSETNVVAERGSSNAGADDVSESIQKGIEAYFQKQVEKKKEELFGGYQKAEEFLENKKRIYGNPNARFTIVEYSDLECPFCKQFHSTPKELVDASGGNINWEWQDFPLSMHGQVAMEGHYAAYCVNKHEGNRAFWVFIDQFFEKTGTNGQGVSDLDGLLVSVGANPGEIKSCMRTNEPREALSNSLDKGTQRGVRGTPASFIVDNRTGNSHRLDGAQPAQSIASVIRQMYEAEKETKGE